jgi:hypothetical protein
MTRTRLSARTLNALGIPARRLSLRQGDYHVDMGRCHVVCEAWIDDFCSWVILDGQNGLYWTDDDGEHPRRGGTVASGAVGEAPAGLCHVPQ